MDWLGDGVDTARVKGVAASKAGNGQTHPTRSAVPGNGLLSIDAATRKEPAISTEKGGKNDPVGLNAEEQETRSPAGARVG